MNVINSRSLMVALLLSLLLHLFLSLYFAIKNQNPTLTSPNNDLNKQEKIDKKKEIEWAETHGKNSQGSPVIFMDEPDDETIAEIAEQNSPHDNTSQQAESLSYPEKEDSTDKTASNTLKKSLEISIDPPKQQLSNHNKKTITPQAIASNRSPQLKMAKKPLSLAQLTQGVLNYARQEGNSAVSMIGKKGAMPTDEQIRYERYTQKLNWCLTNSGTINSDKCPNSRPPKDTLTIQLALNRNGSIKHLYLQESCGDKGIDNFFMFIFKDASGSFPPVPSYLPDNPFCISYLISINSQQSQYGIYRR